jgi:hypothetical protein
LAQDFCWAVHVGADVHVLVTSACSVTTTRELTAQQPASKMLTSASVGGSILEKVAASVLTTVSRCDP